MSRFRSLRTITGVILERLAEAGEIAVDSFFPAKYPQARMWRTLLSRQSGTFQVQPRTLAAILYRLQSEGLVVRTGGYGKAMWALTKRGRAHLASRHNLPKRDGIRRLVIFDVPERERVKRDAMRGRLVAAGFTQLQKSVWYGEQPLPSDFIDFIDACNLREKVHIFSIEKRGTL